MSRRSPPNQRLKLAAPCVGGRVAFVHPTVWRRSLPFLGLSQRMRKTLTAAVELEILDLVEEGRRIAERLEGLSLAIRNDGGARQELIKAHRSVTMHQVVNAQARAHQAGYDAYFQYLETLPAKDQGKPYAVANAIDECVNAALKASGTPEPSYRHIE